MAGGLALAAFLLGYGQAPVRAEIDSGDAILLEEPRIDLELDGIDPSTLEVMIGDALGNDFIAVDGDQAVLTVPFPESTEPFLVTITDNETGEVLVEQVFRMSPYRPFDKIDFDVYGQIDPYGRFFQRVDPRPERLRQHGVDIDAVGGGSWRGEVGDVALNFEAEGVVTSERFKRFRPDGGPADLSHVLGAVDYQTETVAGHLEFGDANFQGNNSVVNEGFTTHGGSMELGFFDNRVRFTGGFGFGTDVAGAEHFPGFDEQDSNRLTGGVDVTLWRDDYVNLTLHGSFYNAERPDDFGAFQTAETPVGERNRILGTGATLGLFDDRVVVSSSFGWSEYGNPSDLDFGVTDFVNPSPVTVGNENDTAERHKIDARIWDGETLQVDGYAQYESAGPFYRALDAYIPPDRSTYLYGGTIYYDLVTLDFSSETFETNIEGIPGVLSTKEGTDRGSITFDLDRFRHADYYAAPEDGQLADDQSGCFLCKLIPSTVSFEAEQWDLKGTNGDDLVMFPTLFFTEDLIPNERLRSYALDFGWDFDAISTELGFFHAFEDDSSEGNGDADVRENSIQAGAGYFGDVWNLSSSVSFALIDGLQVNNQATDYEYIWDANFGLRLEDLPDFSARAEVNLFRTKADLDSDDSRELSYRAQGTLDFSKYLPEVAPGLDSYLTTTFLYQWGVSKDSFSGISHSIDMAWTVNFGLEF